MGRMLSRCSGRTAVARLISGMLLAWAGFCLSGHAADAAARSATPSTPGSGEALEQYSASGLLQEATTLLSDRRYDQAVPLLKEYLKRMQGSSDSRVLALMQEIRLKLAKISDFQQDPATAVAYLRQYTEGLPLYRPREAWKLLAFSLYKNGEYEECIHAVTNALALPLPKEIVTQKKAVVYEELSKEERAGLTARQLRRIDKYAGEDDDLSQGLSGESPEPEPDFTLEERLSLKLALGQASMELGQWEPAVESLRYVLDHADKDEQRGVAAVQLVEALLSLERFDETVSLLTNLCQTTFRYQVSANRALLEAADGLLRKEKYDQALRLYRMVLPRMELVGHYVQEMNDIRRYNGLPDVQVTIKTNATGRLETLFGYLYGGTVHYEETAEEKKGKPAELMDLELKVDEILALPPYEDEMLYNVGTLFASAGRPWEAAAVFQEVTRRNPEGDRGQQAFYDYLQVLIDPLKEYDRAESLAKAFLDTHRDGLAPRQVALALTTAYQKQGRMADIKKLTPFLQGFAPSTDVTIRQFECELWYMQAIADLVLLNYKEAEAGLSRVLQEFPGSLEEENLIYWHAMSLLFLQDYAAAFKEFEQYPVRFPSGGWLAEASFRGGVCLFGMEQDERAMERFTDVIKTWPESAVYSDACSLRADLLAAKGKLTEAQAGYEEAIRAARNERQAGYPTFQMAAMFELEKRYDEILAAVQAYLNRYGKTADVAKAAYWIGKTQLAQGHVREAVASYLDAIVQYGGDVQQAGVDQIISELNRVSRRMLDDPQRRDLEMKLKDAAQAAGNMTLQLRLRVLLAEMDGTTLELGRKLIKEIDDLRLAPPPVLSLICEASFHEKDYSRAEEILTIFRSRYEDSEFMGAALKLRAFDLFSHNQYDQALKIAEETQAVYGTDPDAAWAQIMKGRIQIENGQADVARKTLLDVLTVRAWRGEPYAEASCRLGELEENGGDLRKAFNWYQRTYMQYKGYARGYWAAEAYLASARCLETIGTANDVRNTYRAMLFDKYVNTLPQAEVAKKALGTDEVNEISTIIAQGIHTNLTVTLEADKARTPETGSEEMP